MSQDVGVLVCPAAELEPGQRRVIAAAGREVLVLNCGGELLAIENCCSHEEAPLDLGTVDEIGYWIECPRHGSRFDLRSGRPLNLPAYQPVEVFDVAVVDGMIAVEVD